MLASAEWYRGTVREDAREVPVLAEVDVVVAGGGEAGQAAAIAAARTGSKTILLERSGFLGGLLTAQLAEKSEWENDENGRQILAGVWEETKQRLISLNASPGTLRYDGPMYGPRLKVPAWACFTIFDPETLKYVLADRVQEAGAKVFLHALFVGVVKEGERLRGVIIEGKSGRQAILGKVVVDCTGDADVCYAAGVPCQKGRERDGQLMGSSLHVIAHGIQPGPLWEYVQTHPEDVPRWARLVPIGGGPYPPQYEMIRFACHGFQISMEAAKARGELYFTHGELGIWPLLGRGQAELNVTRVNVDGTEISGLTTAQLETRKQATSIIRFLKREVPGFQDAYISHSASEIQCRETRRIVGEYVMTVHDLMKPVRFSDSVAMGIYPIEVHIPDTGQREWQFPQQSYQIPYRIFHPRGVENLIVGSARSLSTVHEVAAAIRVTPIPMATGQAAGVAAGLAARRGVTPTRLDIREIREALIKQGAVVE